MPRSLKQLFTAFVCFVGSACAPSTKVPPTQAVNTKERWAVYYATELPASAFKGYDLVVFDRRYHPDFKELKGETIVLAYISIGEVHGGTEEQALLESQGALIGTRTKWDSYPVDITHPTWAKMMDAQVEHAMANGFDGIMIDTLDTALLKADMDSNEKAAKAQDAAVRMIAGFREHYPNIKIMLNRGFEVLPRVASAIDYALGESLLAETDVSTGQSKVFPATTYQSMASRLLQARAIAPNLKIYTLDYWDQADVDGLQKLYAIHRARGFHPYVTTPDLKRHTPEPEGAFNPQQQQKIA